MKYLKKLYWKSIPDSFLVVQYRACVNVIAHGYLGRTSEKKKAEVCQKRMDTFIRPEMKKRGLLK